MPSLAQPRCLGPRMRWNRASNEMMSNALRIISFRPDAGCWPVNRWGRGLNYQPHRPASCGKCGRSGKGTFQVAIVAT